MKSENELIECTSYVSHTMNVCVGSHVVRDLALFVHFSARGIPHTIYTHMIMCAYILMFPDEDIKLARLNKIFDLVAT